MKALEIPPGNWVVMDRGLIVRHGFRTSEAAGRGSTATATPVAPTPTETTESDPHSRSDQLVATENNARAGKQKPGTAGRRYRAKESYQQQWKS
jgi:hypothetical protein